MAEISEERLQEIMDGLVARGYDLETEGPVSVGPMAEPAPVYQAVPAQVELGPVGRALMYIVAHQAGIHKASTVLYILWILAAWGWIVWSAAAGYTHTVMPYFGWQIPLGVFRVLFGAMTGVPLGIVAYYQIWRRDARRL